MSESGFKRGGLGLIAGSGFDSGSETGVRVPLPSGSERYDCFKVRRYGKLHFEKRPSARYAGDLLTSEALRKEFEVGYGLDHPGVVRYLAYEGGSLFEEYVDGKTLRTMMEEGDPRFDDMIFLRNLCNQLIGTLEYIHSHGILHLDLKPENVMVETISGRVKIIDFGCARSSAFDTTEGYTHSYKAPEQAEGLTGISTDYYLLGRLMEELSLASGHEEFWKVFVASAMNSDLRERIFNAIQARTLLAEVGHVYDIYDKLVEIARHNNGRVPGLEEYMKRREAEVAALKVKEAALKARNDAQYAASQSSSTPPPYSARVPEPPKKHNFLSRLFGKHGN